MLDTPRLLERLGKHAADRLPEWLRSLTALTMTWLEDDTTDAIAASAFRCLSNTLDAAVSLTYVMAPDGRLHLRAAAGVDDEVTRHLQSLDLGDEVCRTVALTKRPRHIEPLDVAGGRLLEFFGSNGPTAYSCLPLLASDGLLGTFSVGRRHRAFDPGERDFLEVVANLASIAIERVELRARQSRMANELRRHEAFLRRLFEHLPGTSVAVLDRELRYAAVTGRGFHGAGRDAADAIGDAIADVHDEPTAALLSEHYLRALAGAEVQFDVEWGGRHHRISAAPLDRENGHISSIVAVAYDDTDRIEREHALAQSEERYRLVARASTSAIWEYDVVSGKMTATEEMASLFGHPTDDPLIARDGFAWWVERVHLDDRPDVVARFTSALNDGNVETWREVYRFMRGDGSYAWVRDTAVIARDATGRAVRLFGSTLDITTDQEELTALRDEQRRTLQFLATLGHELRHPLSAMVAALAVAHTSMLENPPESLRAARVLDRQIGHLSRLVDDVLDLASAITSQLTIERTVVDLRNIVSDTVDAVKGSAADKAVTIEWDPPSLAVFAAGDSHRLCQVVSNLLTNALKFTPAGGRITVTTRREEGRAIVEVRDTGLGIDTALLPSIFDWFTQGASAGTGFGIGLALARHIVEAHGGTIAARSDGPATGAEFIVELPAWVDTREVTVLIVDDEASVRDLLSAVVRRHNMRAIAAADGHEALWMLGTRGAVDAIIVDLQMPNMDGVTLCKILRGDVRFAHIPILMMSGSADLEQRAAEAGATGTLSKPFSRGALAPRLREMLEKA